jgi:hypothetical protein
MIVDIQIIRDKLRTNRIAGVIDQQLGMAKHIVHLQIQKPTSEMYAYYLPSGNVVVTPKSSPESVGAE